MNLKPSFFWFGVVAIGTFSFGACTSPSKSGETAQESTSAELIASDAWSQAQIAEYPVSPFEDKHGNLWFGALGEGAIRYDGDSLVYITEKDGLLGGRVLGFVEDNDGNLWIANSENDMYGKCAASRLNGSTFEHFYLQADQRGSISDVFTDNEGEIWASGANGVYRFNGEAFEKFDIDIPESDLADEDKPTYCPWDMMEDSKGNKWIGSDYRGAYRIDGSEYTHFSTDNGLITNNVTVKLEDQKGNIWISCYSKENPENIRDGGLCMYNGSEIITFPEVKGLTDNDIFTLFEDRAGNLWIGASGVGVYKYDGETFTLYDQMDRTDLNTGFGLQGILEDSKGEMWFCFCGGLFRFNGESFYNVSRGGPWH